MVLVCNLISQDHVIKGSCNFLGENTSWKVTTFLNLLVIGIEVVEIFLMIEEQDSKCSCLNLPLLFISKGHRLKALGISC